MKHLRVQGSHFDCGFQIGQACRDELQRIVSLDKKTPPEGLTWEECLRRSNDYLSPTERRFPFLIDEIRGAAKGANLDPLELFTFAVEELWVRPSRLRNCTDIVVCPPATKGEVIIGHNNDLGPAYEETLAAVQWNLPDDLAMFTVGLGGIFVSAGVNNYHLALTGSELTQTDNKIGIPRGYIAQAILSATTFEEGLAIALDPNRASSYNNIISTTDHGKIVSVEGSATDYALLYPQNGRLSHANHYLDPKMQKHEGHPEYTSSLLRHERAEILLDQYKVAITVEDVKNVLRDHGKDHIPSADTICRHGDTSKTVFSMVINLATGVVELTSGNPCQNKFEKVWQIK